MAVATARIRRHHRKVVRRDRDRWPQQRAPRLRDGRTEHGTNQADRPTDRPTTAPPNAVQKSSFARRGGGREGKRLLLRATSPRPIRGIRNIKSPEEEEGILCGVERGKGGGELKAQQVLSFVWNGRRSFLHSAR